MVKKESMTQRNYVSALCIDANNIFNCLNAPIHVLFTLEKLFICSLFIYASSVFMWRKKYIYHTLLRASLLTHIFILNIRSIKNPPSRLLPILNKTISFHLKNLQKLHIFPVISTFTLCYY